MNRVALVTGGSSGIGRAISFELAKRGNRLMILSDIDTKSGIETVSEIRQRFSVEAEYFQCDVSNFNLVEKVVASILERFERIDILINNAGITRDGILERINVEDWKRVLDVNLSGTFYCTKAVMPQMKANRYGKIVNISSVSAENGNIGQANYAASKGGVISLTKTAAREGARYGVNVNAIAPGFVRTRMLESMPPKILTEKILPQIPLGRLGEPEEVAVLAAFLASDEANYITGQVINISGGMYV